MSSWGSYSFLYGPIVALLGIGVLIMVLRWGWQKNQSLIAKPVKRGAMTDYGVLVSCAKADTVIEAEIMKRKLIDKGIQATVALTNEGPRVMVWPEDQNKAKNLLA
ncbi:MAG: hypothetical protein ACO3XJ_04080 [Candidatus Nanopelagicales bacterium]